MSVAIIFIPLLIGILWLLSIRPYCIRNREGHTPGASIGITLWVDWQQATEIAKAKGDAEMIFICRVVFWLHVAFACIFLFGFFSH